MPVITVGADKEFQTIQDAVAASGANDTIDVDAGTYTNDFVTIGHNLTLEAVGGTVNLVATEPPPNAKGLIDEGGAGVTVDIRGFDISGVQISDGDGGNGAGIRYEGGTLVLNGDNIHGNQDGLLANPDPNGTITIENSVFAGNGSGTGFTHNIYVNDIALFTITGSTVTGAVVGHEIKSRAENTVITNNRIEDGPTGTASYDIDLPNGGNATITGNVIEKGPNAENPNAISMGEEGSLHASSSAIIENNAIINDLASSDATAVVNDTGVAAVVDGNVLYGWPHLVSGPADIGTNTTLAVELSLDSFIPGDITAPCYGAGTRILTPAGETAVENLRGGDMVVARHAGMAPITWIGHRHVDCRRHPRPVDVWPVRVCRDAFGAGQPHRDLLLSPDHAVFIDGVLIPIRYLVNGRTVVQERRDTVTYWHVELGQHDIVLAEGLPAETYLDTGNRGAFENGGPVMRLHPDFSRTVWHRRACAELIVVGAELEAARSYLLERAELLGHAMTGDPALHLVVDGCAHWPRIVGDRYCFALPATAHRIRLASRSAVPAELHAAASDHRRLGVAVARIELEGGEVALSDPRLGESWHAIAPDESGWRWTDGDAGLDIAGERSVVITVAIAGRYWLELATDTRVGRAMAARQRWSKCRPARSGRSLRPSAFRSAPW